jgi:hypothetical protein
MGSMMPNNDNNGSDVSVVGVADPEPLAIHTQLQLNPTQGG